MNLWITLTLAAGLADIIAEIFKNHLTTIPFPYTSVQGVFILSRICRAANWHSARKSANLQNIYNSVKKHSIEISLYKLVKRLSMAVNGVH